MPGAPEGDRRNTAAGSVRRSAQRQQTINIRVQATQVAVIDQAASSLGQTRSAFMLERSIQAAEAVLLDERLFLADDAIYDAFRSALTAPVQRNPRLAALLSRKAPWAQ